MTLDLRQVCKKHFAAYFIINLIIVARILIWKTVRVGIITNLEIFADFSDLFPSVRENLLSKVKLQN